MERCERFEELLSQRLDQPLLPEEERELEDHLARCPHCRALAEDLEQLCGQFACLEELPAPEGFARGVMDRIRALEPEPAPAEGPEERKEETEPQEQKVVPLRRPMPRWARTAAALAACCVLGFGVYQAGLIDQISPAAQSGESAGVSDSVAAYAAPAPGEDEETSGAAAALPAPEEGQQPVYDSRAQHGAGAGTEEEDHASTQKRTAQAPVHSQTAAQDQPVTMPPSLNDGQNADGDTGDGSGSTESVVGIQAVLLAPQSDGLTLPQLPRGAEEILDGETAWTDNGDGTRSCTITADQARQILDLAREQGMDCPEVGTEEETLVLTVPGEEG